MPLPTTFLTTDDLTAGQTVFLLQPNAIDSAPEANALANSAVVESPGGARLVDSDPATARARPEWEFLCETHAERTLLEAFFDAQQGMAGGFWFPTWQWEFALRGYTRATFTSQLWVTRWQAESYASAFAAGRAFRKLALIQGDTVQTYTVTAVTESVAPGVDLLDVTNDRINNGGFGSAVPPMGAGPDIVDDTYRPLWLRWGRFDQDERVDEALNADGACRIRLALTELPDEVPA